MLEEGEVLVCIKPVVNFNKDTSGIVLLDFKKRNFVGFWFLEFLGSSFRNLAGSRL